MNWSGNKNYVFQVIGAASGHYTWSDLKFYKALSAARHGIIHFLTGFSTVTLGLIIWVRRPFLILSYQPFAAGLTYIFSALLASLLSCPKYTVIG